jgi:ABC-2 type transport system ATP-binding protein
MSEPVLEISGARRRFAERKVLHEVSIRVAQGEILALLGPNGAGKTTLMRAAAGRLRLEAGTVRVAGRDPAIDKAARGALGIVPQTLALYPHLTAQENLDVFARLMGLKGKAVVQAVRDGLEQAGLGDRGHDVLADLSGGMQRRLNIVAGTLHKPQLLLLDEPTVGVDLTAREAIHALLHDLRDSGMGMLLTTHDFDQAASIADRVAFMLDGRILVQGSVASLIQKTFGTAKELVVSLDSPADSTGKAILQSFRLRPTRDSRLWSGPLIGGYEALGQIEQQLEQSGLHAAEIRLRDPGLNGVFLQLAGEEAEA